MCNHKRVLSFVHCLMCEIEAIITLAYRYIDTTCTPSYDALAVAATIGSPCKNG